VLLDGGLATELQRHSVPIRAPWYTTEPLLSPAGRELVRDVHAAYVAAGAEVLTAATFRTNRRAVLRAGGDEAQARALCGAAVSAARDARVGNTQDVRVAASVAPVEDCYRPDLVPPASELRTEHTWMARVLAEAGAELALVETMNSTREALVAVECTVAAGLPTWLSLVCTTGARLLSGDDLGTAARLAESAGAAAVLVNCTAPGLVPECLAALREACTVPIGVYANAEDRSSAPTTHVEHRLPTAYGAAAMAALAVGWRDQYGVQIAGGCCGTTPEHVRALDAALNCADQVVARG
jgi:S-methylmethionine-dependent homocysteine/selenocysteine methylase